MFNACVPAVSSAVPSAVPSALPAHNVSAFARVAGLPDSLADSFTPSDPIRVVEVSHKYLPPGPPNVSMAGARRAVSATRALCRPRSDGRARGSVLGHTFFAEPPASSSDRNELTPG